MVASRVSRLSAEVLSNEGSAASLSQVDAQAAGESREANGEEVRVTRIALEVLRAEGTIPSLSKVDSQVAGLARQANGADVQVSRLAVEVLRNDPLLPALSSVSVQAAGEAREANGEDVRVSRISLEVLSRQGVPALVSPLTLASNSDFFLHNWVSRVSFETSYETDIAISPLTGAESRRGLLAKPRRTATFQWGGFTREIAHAVRVKARRISNGRFQVPIYQDQQVLEADYASGDTVLAIDTTLGRWFQGGRVVIVEMGLDGQAASWVYRTIATKTGTSLTLSSSLGQAFRAGSRVLPVIDVEPVLEPEIVQQTARVWGVSMTVQEVQGPSALPPLKTDLPGGFESFDGKPVFDIEPNWIRGVTGGRSRQGEEYRQGRANRVYLAADRSREKHDFEVSGRRSETWPVVPFFDTRRGSLRTFWHIDHDQTLQVVDIDSSGNFVSFEAFGTFSDFNEEWGWLGLVMRDGSVYVREVANVQSTLGVYRVTVTPALPTGLSFDDVLRGARARVTRFDGDTLDENWISDGVSQIGIRLIECLDEQDYPL